MKIEIPNFTNNITDSMRSAGYHYDGQDAKTKELRFYRSVSNNLFPRFHIYAVHNKSSKLLTFTLHLDQKAPVYQGSTAHGGDYEGPVLENELARIKAQFASKNMPKLRPLDL